MAFWLARYMDTANVITLSNVAGGVGAILAAASGHIALACALIVLCGAVDHMDGHVARARNPDDRQARAFGGSLDMVADLIGFSVAPAVLLAWLGGFAAPAIAAALFYALCGALRLVRFELEATAGSRLYAGLPTTYAAYIFVIAAIGASHFETGLALLIGAAVGLGLLQVSSIRIRKPSIAVTAGVMPLVGLGLVIWRM